MVKFDPLMTESTCRTGLQSILLIYLQKEMYSQFTVSLDYEGQKRKNDFYFSVREENFTFITSCKIARAWGKKQSMYLLYSCKNNYMMTISGVIFNGLHFVSISLCNVRAKIIHSKWKKNTCFDVSMAWTFDVLLRHSIKHWLICERSWFTDKVLCL